MKACREYRDPEPVPEIPPAGNGAKKVELRLVSDKRTLYKVGNVGCCKTCTIDWNFMKF